MAEFLIAQLKVQFNCRSSPCLHLSIRLSAAQWERVRLLSFKQLWLGTGPPANSFALGLWTHTEAYRRVAPCHSSNKQTHGAVHWQHAPPQCNTASMSELFFSYCASKALIRQAMESGHCDKDFPVRDRQQDSVYTLLSTAPSQDGWSPKFV